MLEPQNEEEFKMDIGIVGLGVVGTACKNGFEKIGHIVKYHDVKFYTNIEDVLDTEVCFVSVPTPSNEDGSCDISIVEEVVGQINDLKYKGVLAIKSTVEPGTNKEFREKYKNLRLYFVPEFLRERCATEDFIYNHNILVIGAEDEDAFNTIKEAHGDLPVHTVKVNPLEAELVKYFSNNYKALRITFANSFYKLCQELGANYDVVKDAFLFHGVGEGHYLNVNKEFGGFGGTCLPKDTKGLAFLIEKLGLDLNIFKTVVEENDKFIVKVPEGMRKEI